MTKDDKMLSLIKEINECRPHEIFELFYVSEKGIYAILNYLFEHNTETVAGDLSRDLNISTARVAVLLKKMEFRGFIKKYKSDKDMRKTIVVITNKGKKALNKLKIKLVNEMNALIEKVGIEDIETFLKISKKIKITMSKTNLGYLSFQKII